MEIEPNLILTRPNRGEKKVHSQRERPGSRLNSSMDAATISVSQLVHPRKFELKGAIPWFRRSCPVGVEHEQPELLGFGRNARVGTFGPENISCGWWLSEPTTRGCRGSGSVPNGARNTTPRKKTRVAPRASATRR